ncbi:MAG: hypothetical protein K1Y36_15630 [Blastocatellia bacterium]|nr:hypothetical protein [Blastocatellia bacterium]
MLFTSYCSQPAPEKLAEIHDFTSRHESLQDVFTWAMKGHPGMVPHIIERAVIQDEYTHDLVIPWNGLWLVYGTT